MLFEQFLNSPGAVFTAPWVGGQLVSDGHRTWTLAKLPREHGWYEFEKNSGKKTLVKCGPCDPPIEITADSMITGYLVDNRLIPQDLKTLVPVVELATRGSHEVFLLPEGLDKLCKIKAFRYLDKLVFAQQVLPEDVFYDVVHAYEDKTSIVGLKGITPALSLAFEWLCFRDEERIRIQQEEDARLRAAEAARLEEQRRAELIERLGTVQGRLALLETNPAEACRAALAVYGAEYRSHTIARGRLTVRYCYGGYRLECDVCPRTMRVIDSGICLTDHDTGRKGDTLLTLESLPSVIQEAIDGHKLVIYRRG